MPTKPNAIVNQIVRLWKGDVTHLVVDAVQNAANSGLWAGSGLCGAIHKAAGHKLAKACKKYPVIHQKSIYDFDSSIFGRADESFGRGDRCDVGDTKITPGYNLPSKYVLHTVGPRGVKPDKLRSSYRSALEVATKAGLRSVALCCISTGIYGYPVQQATPVALSAVREWLEEGTNATKLDAVIFCVFQDKELSIYRKWFPIFYPPVAGQQAAFPKLQTRAIVPPTMGKTVSKLESVRLDDDDDDDDDGISTKIDHTKDNAAAASAPPSYNDATQNVAQQVVVQKTGIPLKAAIEILRLCDNDVERAINFQRTNLRDFIRIVDESL